MKRKSLGIVGLFVALFSIITCISSCEVVHTYKAEVRVVNANGAPMSGVDVTTNVDAYEKKQWKAGSKRVCR